jgi:putative toxin-antitoxin system antitoxin component (TIGR02293 family)
VTGLYDPRFEHDSCGVGFIAATGGRTHGVLELGLEAVANLTHRGAVSSDGKTGDGAGVLTQIPYRILLPDLHRSGVRVPRYADLGVGMIFLPQETSRQARARALIEDTIIREGMVLFGWRSVPVSVTALGDEAARTRPEIAQVLEIPDRTLARRKARGKFARDESEKLLRLSTVFEKAVELFEGDVPSAVAWLKSPKAALEHRTPLDYTRSELGAREVEDLIGRLEHGVFA